MFKNEKNAMFRKCVTAQILYDKRFYKYLLLIISKLQKCITYLKKCCDTENCQQSTYFSRRTCVSMLRK